MAFDVYAAFQEKIKNRILDYLPPEFKNAEVRIIPVKKENGIELQGLSIVKAEENISPTIYLEKYFAEWAGNLRNMDDILKEIAKIRVENSKQLEFDVSQVTDFSKAKDYIVCRLINKEYSEQLLQDIPHTTMEDLAVTYHVCAGVNDTVMGTVRINNQILEKYGLSLEELHEVAVSNMEKQFPITFYPLSELMKEQIKNSIMEEGIDDSKAEMMIDEIMSELKPKVDLYVLTNEQTLYGATAFLYPGMKEKIAEQVGGDYYVLPSSQNEFIILKKDQYITVDELKTMVEEVNQTMVDPDEKLSDHVYVYDAKERVFSRADKEPEREEKRAMSFQEKLKEKKAESKAMESTNVKPDKKKREECL